ncbi:MAG: MFS transporter [Planctomycetales bacterium]|nr:MFS transporter [Planctomycetales bacterium]
MDSQSLHQPTVKADGLQRPTRARFYVVLWLCSMAGVLYLDRVCWAKAAPSIQREFSLSNTQLAYLAMSFQLAYGLFEIPTGRWGELIGARRVLTRITLWWSAFTALSGAATGFFPLLIIRFLFGAGEAGAYPNAARVITRWFPTHERGRVQGVMLSVSLVGGAIAPTLAAYLIDAVGWRWTFVLFGSLGLVWAAGFWFWFRDTPAEHPRVNPQELEWIRAGGGSGPPRTHEAIPWAIVLRNPGILILSAIMMCSAFNAYFYFSWFPVYLESAHGISNTQSGKLTSLALAGAALGVLSGGVIADRLMKGAASPVRRRRIFCAGSFLAAALTLFLAVQAPTAGGLAFLAATSCFFVQLTLPSWWSAAIEQSGRHVGPLFGLMNMMGTLGALASQWFVGVFADYQQARGLSGRAQWDPMFNVYVGVLLFGAICWALYRKQSIS